MKEVEIYKILCEHDEYDWFGLRYDRNNIAINSIFANSHQWRQDEPYGEDLPYIEGLGLWQGEELNGVCTIGLPDSYCLHDKNVMRKIEAALEQIEMYKSRSADTLYLVGGNRDAEGGNDVGELIIENGVCLAIL